MVALYKYVSSVFARHSNAVVAILIFSQPSIYLMTVSKLMFIDSIKNKRPNPTTGGQRVRYHERQSLIVNNQNWEIDTTENGTVVVSAAAVFPAIGVVSRAGSVVILTG
jgi:hypothetical protein